MVQTRVSILSSLVVVMVQTIYDDRPPARHQRACLERIKGITSVDVEPSDSSAWWLQVQIIFLAIRSSEMMEIMPLGRTWQSALYCFQGPSPLVGHKCKAAVAQELPS